MLAPRLPVYPQPGSMERVLDLIFPPLCVGCRRIGRWLCPQCWRQVLWLGYEQTDLLRPSSPLDAIIATAEFDGPAREAVHCLKYEGRHAISSIMGKIMAEGVRDVPINLVSPVPLHASRRRERGYDQAALLARGVARSLEISYRPDTLCRVRRTKQQTTLDAEGRRENVRGAFEARVQLAGETVLLVDDVYTTGATIEAAAQAVRDAGAGGVIGLIFGRAR